MDETELRQLVEATAAGDSLSELEYEALEQAAGDPQLGAEMAFLGGLSGFMGAPLVPSDSSVAMARRAVELSFEEPAAPDLSGPTVHRPSLSRRWALIAIPVAAAVLLGIGLAVLGAGAPGPAVTQLRLASGEVYIDGEPATSVRGPLAEGATMNVGKGRACVGIGSDVVVCLEDDSKARVFTEGGMRVEVVRGTAVAELRPLRGDDSFVLSHDEATARAVGTLYSLTADPKLGTVTAAVAEGVVEVEAAGTRLSVAAGESAVYDGATLVGGTLDADVEVALLGAIRLEAAAPDDALGYYVVETQPPGEIVALDGRPVGRSPVVIAVSSAEHELEVGAGNRRISERFVVDPGSTVRRTIEIPAAPVVATPTAAPRDSPPPPAGNTSPPEPDPQPLLPVARAKSAQQLLKQAQQHRQARRWAAAARSYADLARLHPKSPAAHTALVSAGDIQLDRLKKPAAAAKLYAKYLRSGGGALAQEARLGRVRAYRALGQRTREAAAIDVYLEHHARSARAEALRTRLAELE